MAKLISDNFTADIQFHNYSSEVTDYRFRFTYGENFVFNPLITNNDFFIVDESEDDSLIEVLQAVLNIAEEESSKDFPERSCVIWESDSNVSLKATVCFHVGWKDIEDPEELPLKERERFIAIDNMRAMGAQFPGDVFVLEFGIQSYDLKELHGAIKFPGNQVGVAIIVKRHQLRKFLAELREEYGSFCEKFKINDLGDEVQKFLDGKTKIEEMTDLEKQFDQEMRNIYEKAKKLGMNGDGLIGLIEEQRGVQAAKLLLRGSEEASGAMKLRLIQIVKQEGLDLTVESLVLDPRWESLFTPDDLKIARERFDKWK